MSFEIYQTTAENVIGATDAALQKINGINKSLVAKFLDISDGPATNALCMAEQLGLLCKNQGGDFIPSFPYAVYLITSIPQHKAAIIRFILEQYPPYKTFKFRLALTGLVQEAANQTRTLHSIQAHRDDIVWTLTNLGTFANSLVSEGAGLYRPAEKESPDFLSVLGELVSNREAAELHVRRRIGSEAADWIDEREVFGPIVTGYQKAASAESDPRTPIVYAANAVESFLSQIAKHHNVDIKNANGINAKAERLAQAKHLPGKHKAIANYLGHVRNAADHGIDEEIRKTWEISKTTATEYIHVAQTLISDMVAFLNGKFIV